MSLIVLIQKKKNFTTFSLTLYKLLPGSNKMSPLLSQVSLTLQWNQEVCDLSSQAQTKSLNFTIIYPQNVQLLSSLVLTPMPLFIVKWREVTRSSFKGIKPSFKGIAPLIKGLAPSLLGCMNHIRANNPRQNSF